jgi:hypothetical protein
MHTVEKKVDFRHLNIILLYYRFFHLLNPIIYTES